jgi:hypothetical protein
VQWEALLSFSLVADVIFESPEIDLNLAQIKTEATDDKSLADRGWQDALQSIYPLEINELRIVEGAVNYKDAGDLPPIQITDLDLLAENIRNIRSPEREYPSRLHASARLLDAADLRFDGHADFLAKPHAGVEGDVSLKGLPLEPLKSIARHSQLYVSGGTISGEGEVEYAPKIQRVVLEEARIENVKVDLLTSERSTAPAEKVVTKVAEQVAEPEKRPEVQIAAKRIEIVDSDVGFVNHNADPEYRLFVSDLDATITDYSNARGQGGGTAEMSGLFLGSGRSKVKARFQPAAEKTDFSLDLSIEDTDMRKMNDLFRAHGGFDVKAGMFSFFTELRVSHGRIEGYVKPLFSDLDVYDLEQDSGENPLQQLYEGIIGGVSILFENRPRDEVATRSDISGSIENPETSVVELLIGLIQNAFFKAILPGLEQNVRPGRSAESAD